MRDFSRASRRRGPKTSPPPPRPPLASVQNPHPILPVARKGVEQELTKVTKNEHEGRSESVDRSCTEKIRILLTKASASAPSQTTKTFETQPNLRFLCYLLFKSETSIRSLVRGLAKRANAFRWPGIIDQAVHLLCSNRPRRNPGVTQPEPRKTPACRDWPSWCSNSKLLSSCLPAFLISNLRNLQTPRSRSPVLLKTARRS